MTYTSFKKLAGSIWKPSYERVGLGSYFTPVFYKIIGIETPNEYDSILKFLYEKAKDCNVCTFFSKEIPVSADFDMITYLSSELNGMDLGNLKSADIVLFSDETANKKFLMHLDEVIQLYEKKNSFINRSVKIDFIVKLILWVYTYVKPMEDNFSYYDS